MPIPTKIKAISGSTSSVNGAKKINANLLRQGSDANDALSVSFNVRVPENHIRRMGHALCCYLSSNSGCVSVYLGRPYLRAIVQRKTPAAKTPMLMSCEIVMP